MGLQEEIRVLSEAVDILSRRRDVLEVLGMGIEADTVTDIIEGILNIMAEASA